MNSLSNLLYWADVLPSFACAIQVFCIIGLIAGAILLCLYLCAVSDNDAGGIRALSWVRFAIPALLFLILCSCFVPSKETFYMIAASEAGEEMLKTPEMGKVRQLINKTLDEALNPPK